jgi:hypothetical protein
MGRTTHTCNWPVLVDAVCSQIRSFRFRVRSTGTTVALVTNYRIRQTMRVFVSSLSAVVFIVFLDLSTAIKEAIRRHRNIPEKDWRRDQHGIAKWRPAIPFHWDDPQLLRLLQDAQDPSRTCNAADSVNFQSDDFNMVVFGEDTFGASCNCSECT